MTNAERDEASTRLIAETEGWRERLLNAVAHLEVYVRELRDEAERRKQGDVS